MSISRQVAAQYAILASMAERMTDQHIERPQLPSPMPWIIIGYFTAANALFGTQVLGLGDRCYYGFLAQSLVDARQYVAVIRGTESPIEWLEDAEALLVPGPAGMVSHGFFTLFESLQYEGERASVALSKLTGIDKLAVIAHSLGSALATYLTVETRLMAKYAIEGVFFASPKPGDAAFGHWFDVTVGHDNYTVFNYLRDVVPRLPVGGPFGLGYQSLPGTVVLTPSMSGARINDSLACAHNALSYAALLDSTTAVAGSPCVSL